ncbi:MAG: cyclopropane-fatty-acyl-phospholipid synthase family protein [Pseudomonadota bacterium]
MDGRITIEAGRLHEFLTIVTANLDAIDTHPLQKIRQKFSFLQPYFRRRNHKRHSRANVAHHYDLSDALYRLFLDDDRQYSCAYFTDQNDTLEAAQAAKKGHIAAKLLLEPGARVLDIGCGWGGLALNLAKDAEIEVKGITLSKEQLAVAQNRAEEAELGRQVTFDLLDYREIDQKYDRIVSVGMFEHVGASYFEEFFSTIGRTLKPDGVAVIHSIGRRSPPGDADPWIAKYIFPGGYIPALSETLTAIEKSGLWVTDIEVLRLHYAETLRHWYDRFRARRHLARELYDERFCRMWEFYLAACEMLFRHGDLMVFQIQLAHQRDAVPLTRDYMTSYDKQAAAESFPAPYLCQDRA